MVQTHPSGSPLQLSATGLETGLRSLGSERLQRRGASQHNIFVDLSRSTGAALAFKRHVQLLGVTPSARDIQKIIDWLKASHIDTVLYTTQLGRYHIPALRFADKATGLLAACLDHVRGEYILFFKPPMEHTKKMARPELAVVHEPSTDRTITGDVISQPWTQNEIASAMKLRKELQEVRRDTIERLLVRTDHNE